MTRSLLEVAEEVAGGRIAAVLEGGYDLDAIRGSSEAVLTELSHGPRLHAANAQRSRAFDRLREILAPHWQL
jgi:acetoin utilization deacetylase AcuC-like enzyme